MVSSIGMGGEAFFDGLLQKRSGITSLANRTDGCAVPAASEPLTGYWIGGPVTDFDAKQYVRPRKSLKVMCREIQTAFAASQMAVDESGLSESFPLSDSGELQSQDVGTVFGSEMFYGSPLEMEDAIKASVTEDGTFDPSMFGGGCDEESNPPLDAQAFAKYASMSYRDFDQRPWPQQHACVGRCLGNCCRD